MTTAPALAALSLVALLALASAGCGGCDAPRPGPSATEGPPADASARPAPPAPSPSSNRVLVDFVRDLPGCDTEHHGPLLDLGTDAMIGRYAWGHGTPTGVTAIEHDGGSWARVTDRKLTVSFTLTEPSPVFVAARAIAYGARSAAVALDDQPLGTLSLSRGQPRIATTGATNLPLDAGLHLLTLRFSGHVRPGDAFADLDWLRVGIPDDATTTFGPPTLHDLEAPAAALGGVPHRALALRAPGSVRCAARLPDHARLRVALGVQGTGEGEAQVRVLVDGKKPEVLRTVRLEGSERAAWLDLDLPLGPYAGRPVSVELRATAAPPGGRVLFGDPTIALPTPAPPAEPAARLVLVIVLSAVERSELPPWRTATTPPLPALTELSQTATTFLDHRAPTTVVSSVVASILTGLPPAAHGLTDSNARLSASQTTIGGVARDASVHTAMFTGVPYTFRAFGFGASWEKFVELDPRNGDAATAPIDAAAAWLTEVSHLKEGARMLAFVHARGSHPPWDVTAKELGAAPPPDYAGQIEPRKAAESLVHLRKKRAKGVLNEADFVRLHALEQLALAGQDRAIGALVAGLRAANLWDATLLVVTGDVGSGLDEGALFADGLDLKEPLLQIPLYVHFPGGLHGGKAVVEPTEAMDLARTSLTALGLGFSKPPPSHDLAMLASGLDPAIEPQVATLDNRYSARWGDFILAGHYPAAPALCDTSVDATCAFNRRDAMPLTTSALFRRLVALDTASRAPPERREPATVDPETAAALKVWGALE